MKPAAMIEQRRADGSLRHLITLADLGPEEIEALLERAQHYVREVGDRPPASERLKGVTYRQSVQPSPRHARAYLSSWRAGGWGPK